MLISKNVNNDVSKDSPIKVVQEMFLFRSLLRSFSGGNSRELALSVMHVLCVVHVQSARAKRVTCVGRANVFAH